jgi:cytosine/adenosine deaminase-related metal-dependent hydrolase/ubiquinone/menaquinone biosynthesis C-methylase UbiE
VTATTPSIGNPADALPPPSSREAFAAWAKVYDDLPNPMLALEQRFLAQLIPDVRGLDVVEIGCGTGRWLELLASQSPRSLVGVDSSSEMVERARRKLLRRATILPGDATSLPLPNLCADVILVPFVASYVSGLDRLASEIRRIARDDARIYISDLHPETMVACNWTRAFTVADARIEVPTYARSVQEVISGFASAGFEVTALLVPPFGVPEEGIFQRAGKMDALQAAAGRPAIYILQVRNKKLSRGLCSRHGSTGPDIDLIDARVAFGASEALSAQIRIEDGRISSIGSPTHRRALPGISSIIEVNLSGYIVLPGLINSHDHLEFGLFPNLGRGPYGNAQDWATDIQRAERAEIERQQKVPKDVRLWWGAIRNLLCGVTTVCHHNPLAPELLGENFPVRVLQRFGWAHSVAMDSDVPAKFQATPGDVPFILHAAEGLDTVSANEVFELDRMHVLDERTVLVHGLALTGEGISLVNRRGAALIWCPTSNHFLFGRTHTPEVLSDITNVVLGSDSPLTAAGDLLDEARFAYSEKGIEADELYRMLSTRPARVFRLKHGEGSLIPGAAADLIAVRDRGAGPAKTLVGLKSEDIELVVVAGRVQLVSQTMREGLPREITTGLQALEIDGQIRWIRAPLGRLFAEAEQVLGCDLTIGRKRVRHVCTTCL